VPPPTTVGRRAAAPLPSPDSGWKWEEHMNVLEREERSLEGRREEREKRVKNERKLWLTPIYKSS